MKNFIIGIVVIILVYLVAWNITNKKDKAIESSENEIIVDTTYINQDSLDIIKLCKTSKACCELVYIALHNEFKDSITRDDLNFILTQSIIETGWYKSNVYKTKNNLFGMLNVKTGYYSYESWYDCIVDYKKRFFPRYKKYLIDNPDSTYKDFIGSFCYAEDPDYNEKVSLLALSL